MEKKTNRWGWAFLIVASAMIMIFSFYPMFSALIMSFKTGSSANMKWATPWYNNYLRMFKDKTFIMSLKNGYDTVLTDSGVNISKGQKQLLTIARAMLSDSRMLILDEATSNVDSHTEQLIRSWY